jgi:hypothetical protein
LQLEYPNEAYFPESEDFWREFDFMAHLNEGFSKTRDVELKVASVLQTERLKCIE